MKKKITLLILTFFCCVRLLAQVDDIRKAARQYDGIQSLAATVTRTTHNVVMAEDAVTKGSFYFLSPCRLCIVLDEVGEKLVTDGTTFVMAKDGKEHVAPDKGQNPYKTLITVLSEVAFADGDMERLADLAQVDIQLEGNLCYITVEPILKNNKEKRRTSFTSFVVTLDLDAAELRSIRINERGENYTQYDFAGYKLGADVPEEEFQVQSL